MKRECDCQEYVTACIHFDGKALRFSDLTLLPEPCRSEARFPYRVTTGYEITDVDCALCGSVRVTDVHYYGPDLTEAQVAYAVEEQFIRTGDDA